MANSGSSFSTTDIILTGVGGAAGLLTILACIYWRYCRARGVGETQPLLSSTTPPNNALRNDATVSSSAPPSSPPPPPITATSISVNATTDSLPVSPPPPPPPTTSTPTQLLINSVVVNVNGTDQSITRPVVADVLSFMKSSNVPVANATVDSADSAAILQEINSYISNGDNVYSADAKKAQKKLSEDLKVLETMSASEIAEKVKGLIKYIDSCITLFSKSLLDGDERYKRFGCVLYNVTALPDIKEMGDGGISFKAAYVRLQNNLYYVKTSDKSPAWKCVKTDAVAIQTIDKEMKPNSNPLFLPPEDLQKITSLTGHSHIMHQYHAALISARKKIKETFNYQNVNSVAQSRQGSPLSTPRVVMTNNH